MTGVSCAHMTIAAELTPDIVGVVNDPESEEKRTRVMRRKTEVNASLHAMYVCVCS